MLPVGLQRPGFPQPLQTLYLWAGSGLCSGQPLGPVGNFQYLQVRTGLPWRVLAPRVQAQSPGLRLVSTSCMPGTVLVICREPHGVPRG